MEDKYIVDLYWERDEKAITETAAKYGRYCYSIAFNILSNTEDAEEGTAGEEDDEPEGGVADNQPQIDYDAETGYPIDPNTGELLDPNTYMPLDNTASDLGGIGALVDDSAGLRLEE